MLGRCEPDGWQQRNKPAYIGCEVHPDFIKFQDFAAWCHKQVGFGVEGFCLDKDILIPDNKVYGSKTCCFVPMQINNLMIKQTRNRGNYPIGIHYYSARDRYEACISINGKNKQIGRFKTVDEAVSAYASAKKEEIKRQLTIWEDSIDPRVVAALLAYVP